MNGPSTGITIGLIIALVILYMYFTGISLKSIEGNILGGLISAGIMFYAVHLTIKKGGYAGGDQPGEGSTEFNYDNNKIEGPGLKSLLKASGGSNPARINDTIAAEFSANGTVNVTFVATPESAGGVVVENPEQYLYTLIVMKLPKNAKDLRNARSLKILAGNIPASEVNEDANGKQHKDRKIYSLRIADKHMVLNELAKSNPKRGYSASERFYIRVLRQTKPIDYSVPKDKKNYDIERTALANNLQSIGELYAGASLQG